MKRLLATLLFVLSIASAAEAYPISKPHTYIDSELLSASIMNPNLDTLYSWANGGVDNTNIGAAGIFASQIKPTSPAQATFSGGWGWTITSTNTAAVTTTVNAPSGQSVDIFDVQLNGVNKFAVGSAGAITFSVAPVGPNGGTFLDTSATAQNKTGALTVGGLTSGAGVTVTSGNISTPGTVTAGSTAYAPNIGDMGMTRVVLGPSSGPAFISNSGNSITLSGNGAAATVIAGLNGSFSTGSSTYGATSATVAGPIAASSSFLSTGYTGPSSGNVAFGYNGGANFNFNAFAAGVTYYFYNNNGSVFAPLSTGAINTNSNTITTGPITVNEGTSPSIVLKWQSNLSSGFTHIGQDNASSVASITATALAISNTGVANLAAIDSSGNMGIAGTFFSASLRALKNNIVPLTAEESIGLANSTTISRFCYKTEKCKPGEHRHIGFIADDTHSDFSGKKHDHMDVNAVAATALADVKVLLAKNAALEARIAKLEAAHAP